MQAVSPCTTPNMVERVMKSCSQKLHSMLHQSGICLRFMRQVQHQLVMPDVFILTAAVVDDII